MVRQVYIALALAAVTAGCAEAVAGSSSTTAGTAMTLGGDVDAGKRVFSANCATCHGATGVEGGVGPSLCDERSRLDSGAAATWIEDPQPPMPKLYPQYLTEQQVRDVTAYVESL